MLWIVVETYSGSEAQPSILPIYDRWVAVKNSNLEILESLAQTYC